MSNTTVLTVAGKEFIVLSCTFSLSQEIDATGRPSSVTRGGQITMNVDSQYDNFLFDWMCNNFERKDGSIKFYAPGSESLIKELKFKEGYLVEFDETFNNWTDVQMTVTFTISAKEISMGNGTHRNEWV